MKKQEKLTEIVSYLLRNEKFNNFAKHDIERAIIETRQPLDDRTVANWFNLLWRLEYVVQPKFGVYQLDLVKVSVLDVKIPVDGKQTQLGE